ncbi:putative transferase [Helianthus annuus]|nr:putative transferase [Helianthus annuus]
MQVYHGLDITTNKITIKEQQCIPHHLLGVFDPSQIVINPYIYRKLASKTISNIVSRNGLPLIVGGSNSFIYSLLTKQFKPENGCLTGQRPRPGQLGASVQVLLHMGGCLLQSFKPVFM